MGWTLQDIRTKVRNVTGRLAEEELSTEAVDNYINNYYVYTFPAELKLEQKLVYYEFITVANTMLYDAPAGYTNFVPPSTMDNLLLDWYQSPGYFNDTNPMQVQRATISTGDGSTTVFTATLGNNLSILPASCVVSSAQYYAEDTNEDFYGTATFVGTGVTSVSLNYETGAFSVTFDTAPAENVNVNVSYIPFAPGRPTAVLWYANRWQFFPVPDTSYKFRVGAYQIVAPLTTPQSTPEYQEWGPCIAYGASRDIHSDLGEMDAYVRVTDLYKEQLAYVLKRTHQNLLNTRAAPNF